MKTIAHYRRLQIPSYSLPYLVNNDDSGLTDKDKSIIAKYMSQINFEAKKCNGQIIISPSDDEPSFTHCPEFGKACDCVECDILIVK